MNYLAISYILVDCFFDKHMIILASYKQEHGTLATSYVLCVPASYPPGLQNIAPRILHI